MGLRMKTTKVLHLAARTSLTLSLLIFPVQPGAHAAGVVTNCDEASLRAAMVGGGTVTFDCNGMIVLTNTVVITNDVLLDATARSVTISGANAIRLFYILPGATLTIQKLTLADGAAIGTDGSIGVAGGVGAGGAIYNEGGTLKAAACLFLRNHSLGGTGGAGDNLFSPGAGGLAQGGVVFNLNGQVSATNCVFTQNSALGGVGGIGGNKSPFAPGGDAAGGVIYNTSGGTVHIVGSVITSNAVVSGPGRRFGLPSASGIAYGGVIHNAGGNVTLTGGLIASNSCTAELATAANGGAIYQSGGALIILDCTFSANHVQGGRGITGGGGFFRKGGEANGGGICSIGGTIGVTNCALVSNLAEGGSDGYGLPSGSGSGGGIFNQASLSIHNTTLAKNAALGGESAFTPGSGYGGGLYNNGAMALLTYVTIAENMARRSIGTDPVQFGVSQGGGVWNSNASVVLHGTILSGNSSGSNCFGAVIDGGYNLSSDSSCNFTNIGSLNNTDPKLGPLDNYGGSTPTMALLGGSPAIDGGDNGNFPPTDQRGRSRPFGAAPDIGAFESSEPFVIRGKISGATFAEEVLIQSGTFSTTTTNRGFYSVESLTGNSYSVTPSMATYLIVPSNRVVTVGPDQLKVDFKAYRWNALSSEGVSNSVLHLAYAGTNGQLVRVLASSNLIHWVAISTNVIPSTNLYDIFDPTDPPARFYRTAQP